jgi:hypothetical protein
LLERIQNDTDRDRFMSAYEARDYGLVDEVMHRKGPVIELRRGRVNAWRTGSATTTKPT